MRAASKDFETAQLMGIKINSVISLTFIIGSRAGRRRPRSCISRTIPPSPWPPARMPGLKAFVAAVFGGIGSIPGAVIGAFIIGLCENLIKGMELIQRSPSCVHLCASDRHPRASSRRACSVRSSPRRSEVGADMKKKKGLSLQTILTIARPVRSCYLLACPARRSIPGVPIIAHRRSCKRARSIPSSPFP